MLFAIYQLILPLLLLVAAPFCLFGKRRAVFLARLGFGRSLPKLEGCIWIHAVSLGETRAAFGLIRKIRTEQPDANIVLTTGTATGFLEGQKIGPLAAHFYLPFDCFFLLGPVIAKLRPKQVILLESDIWPCFTRLAKAFGARLSVINAKISKSRQRSYARFSWLGRWLLKPVDAFYCQSELHRKELSLYSRKDADCIVTGNIKLDDEFEVATAAELVALRKTCGITGSVCILASTHTGEEVELAKAALSAGFQKVLLVPRHSVRAPQVTADLRAAGLAFTTLSVERDHNETLLLVDECSSLRLWYQLADVAIVGGSFVPGIGGHNILEPVFYKKPTVFGPFMEGQLPLLELALAYQVGQAVPIADLASFLQNFTLGSQAAMQAGAGRLFYENKGALQRTYSGLFEKNADDVRKSLPIKEPLC